MPSLIAVGPKGNSKTEPWDAGTFRRYDLDSFDVVRIRQGISVTYKGFTFTYKSN